MVRKPRSGDHSARDLQKMYHITVEVTRIQQILQNSECLAFRKINLAPPLTPARKQERMNCARERFPVSLVMWRRTKCSDEKVRLW